MFYRPHERVQLKFPEGSGRTKQSFKDECDINKVMKRFEKTGVIGHVAKVQGRYGDFLGYEEYHQVMSKVALVQQMFESLPAKLRKRFANDPAEFLEFAQDTANAEELREMGLLPAAPPAREPDNAPPSDVEPPEAPNPAPET